MTDVIEDLVEREYAFGFHSDLDTDVAPKGLDEDVVRLISAKKDEPDWLLEWRLGRVTATSSPSRSPPGRTSTTRRSTTRTCTTGRRPSPRAGAGEPRRGRPRDPGHVRQARHLPRRAGAPLRCGGRRHRRLGLGGHDVQGEAGRGRRHLLLVLRGRARAPGPGPHATSARSSAYRDNFFAALNSAVFSDGSFCFVPAGVRCPMELSTYFRINAAETGQFERTLIVAEEGASVSYLEGCTAPMRDENQLHAAVVELVALDDAIDQVLDRAELVPGRRRRQGRHLQLRHQAGPLRRAPVEDLLDPGRDRLGDHLEVPERDPAGRRLGRRVLLRGGHHQPPAGRHRHEDDPHRPQHAQHDPVQGHLRRARPEHLPGPGEGAALGDRRPQPHPVRLAAHRARVRRPHVPLRRGEERHRPGRARGVDLEDQRGPAVLLPPARPHRGGRHRR